MACPGCGQVKLPLTAFVKEFASKRFDRHGLGDCYQANARRSAGWLCLVGQLLELCRPCLQELTQFNTAAHPALGDFQCHGRWY